MLKIFSNRMALHAEHFCLRVAKNLFRHIVHRLWNEVFLFQAVEGLWEVNLQLQFIQKFADKSCDSLAIVHCNERARKIALVLMKFFHICKINILTVLMTFLIISYTHYIVIPLYLEYIMLTRWFMTIHLVLES